MGDVLGTQPLSIALLRDPMAIFHVPVVRICKVADQISTIEARRISNIIVPSSELDLKCTKKGEKLES